MENHNELMTFLCSLSEEELRFEFDGKSDMFNETMYCRDFDWHDELEEHYFQLYIYNQADFTIREGTVEITSIGGKYGEKSGRQVFHIEKIENVDGGFELTLESNHRMTLSAI